MALSHGALHCQRSDAMLYSSSPLWIAHLVIHFTRVKDTTESGTQQTTRRNTPVDSVRNICFPQPCAKGAKSIRNAADLHEESEDHYSRDVKGFSGDG